MAQLQSNLNHSSSSSRYGEARASAVAASASASSSRPVDVLASCYVIDDAATQLKGLHYCTTRAAGADPPLAAITASNELTVFPKKTQSSASSHAANTSGRGGATLRIREECERLFCETMKTVFLGERNMVRRGSSLTGVYGTGVDAVDDAGANHGYVYDEDNDNDDAVPPMDDAYFRRRSLSASVSDGSRSSFSSSLGAGSLGARSYMTAASSAPSVTSTMAAAPPFAVPVAWLELWDFVGCGSFRGFLADAAGDQSLFAFFDASVLSRDLKRALMALIELADSALGCANLVICVDRSGAEALPDEAAALLKGLQWAGFSLTTLDTWTGGSCVDVTSSQWIFMGMEL
ncbi:hypothetical protein SCUCBS95973_001470 [Sporothrix curviconia]|uniref:Ornithine decarboxylase antizyme n=1 Tax=Sporothrix curviconia TaxID=1260050 RepID=A0ABP0AYV2_9PEZI